MAAGCAKCTFLAVLDTGRGEVTNLTLLLSSKPQVHNAPFNRVCPICTLLTQPIIRFEMLFYCLWYIIAGFSILMVSHAGSIMW